MTEVRCAVGKTPRFKVKVGVHQGTALSPFMFVTVKVYLTDGVKLEAPWNIVFVDNLVLVYETREEAEEAMER